MQINGRSRAMVAALVSALALLAWGRTRLFGLRAFEADHQVSRFLQGPIFLSAAQGGDRPIGSFSKDQVRVFRESGGSIPSLRMDIREIKESGDVAVLSRVDPGFSWLLAAGRSMGLPLSLVGVARFQVGADFCCLVLTYLLARRLSGSLVAALAALGYGVTTATTPFLVAYYFWSVPLALVFAHLGLSLLGALTPDRRLLWFSAVLLLEMGAIWLRVAWLPAFLLFLPFLLVRERGTRLGLAALTALAAIAISYAFLVARANLQGEGGGLSHPRAQLWHTLYIGLGAYGTWGEIEWLDEYAYRTAATAGVDYKEPVAYERFFKARFLDEVSRHPARYGALLLRRVLDYAGESPARTPVLRRLPTSLQGGLILASCLALFAWNAAPGPRFVAALFCAQVVTWSALVPAVSPYTMECLGLASVVAAAGAKAIVEKSRHRA